MVRFKREILSTAEIILVIQTEKCGLQDFASIFTDLILKSGCTTQHLIVTIYVSEQCLQVLCLVAPVGNTGDAKSSYEFKLFPLAFKKISLTANVQ